ncbi:hypothetical protein [Loktanella fryxellensis]|uniref:hypothetical protein n=1 Tax=Loktanella fryxellensis TaxID=245187 RepID=UPI001C4317DB|nr:hypothetical protein [Loktanella fryxellensis]
MGILPAGVVALMVLSEWTGAAPFGIAAAWLATFAVAALAVRVRAARLAFVAIGLALVIWAAATRGDWADVTLIAMQRGALVMALFTAMAAMRTAAMTAPGILACGRFLARQRPGLRYTALTLGGHLFGLILIYGAISLLGTLATESNAQEPDADIRRQRTRRMMIAIQRGFASTLCWSPLGFSMIIGLSVVEGSSWVAAALPGIAAALAMLVVGWALDSLYKTRVIQPPRRPTESWLVRLRPLLLLLALVMASVGVVHLAGGVTVIGSVMALVPLIALIWVARQDPPTGLTRAAHVRSRVHGFVTRDLTGYREELVLLFMAGFIGSLGAVLLVPLAQAQGLDFAGVPPWVILTALIWAIPLTGQLGMNPILAVSLLVPLLPTPAAMGIPPTAMVIAITSGWALSGATSPYTASVLLAAKLGGVSPLRAGLGWNGIYVLAAGGVLTLWVLALLHFD